MAVKAVGRAHARYMAEIRMALLTTERLFHHCEVYTAEPNTRRFRITNSCCFLWRMGEGGEGEVLALGAKPGLRRTPSSEVIT